jgi:putative ABC transport system substrate-binding protein
MVDAGRTAGVVLTEWAGGRMQFDQLRRRDLITLLAGAAVAWTLPAGAQHRERLRRIGVLMNVAADDSDSAARLAAFAQGLQELGWTIGRNVHLDTRWAAGDAALYRSYAAELAALAPDIILATDTSSVRALRAEARSTPIVFASAVDPIGGGLVASLARPGGNITGFAAFDFGMSGKWVELLKQIAPGVTRVAVLRDPTSTGGVGQFGAIQAVAPSFGVELTPVDVHDAGEIEHSINAFVQRSNGGLIVVSSALAGRHRKLIISLASEHRLPAVYPYRFIVADGGLISYGPDRTDPYRRAASYVDRILKGEKPADLPVQAPTKYELIINLKTARALGIEIPPMLLARADEVIE